MTAPPAVRPGISPSFLALTSLASLLPLLAVVLLFPTPAIDLREHINWGANFPLYTWKHPPLQSWLAGLVALTSLRDAWAYVALAQGLNLVGLYYIVRTASRFIDKEAAIPVGTAFCGLNSFSLGVPDMALNADLIQVPLWLGLFYHTLRGARDNRWFDWLAAGCLAALAILAKYFSLLFLIALALALMVGRQKRSILRRSGPYIGGLLACIMIAPHIIGILAHPDMLAYGIGRTLRFAAPPGDRFWGLGVFSIALAVYAASPLAGLGDAMLRGKVVLRSAPLEGARGTIAHAIFIFLAFLIVLIMVVGFDFRTRFAVPILPLCILLITCFTKLVPTATNRFTTVVLTMTVIAWATAIALALAFPAVYVREPPVPRLYLRDPAPEAAALIKSDWVRRFSCGPAYIVGTDGHAIGLYFGAVPIGLSDQDLFYAPWVDHSRMRELGVIVVAPTEEALHRSAALNAHAVTEIVTLSLPPRRWPSVPSRKYVYYSVPPRQCGGSRELQDSQH
jgi:hypothetical protein